MRVLLVTFLLLVSGVGSAQTARPEQAEKVTWRSIVCAGTPSVCNKLAAQG